MLKSLPVSRTSIVYPSLLDARDIAFSSVRSHIRVIYLFIDPRLINYVHQERVQMFGDSATRHSLSTRQGANRNKKYTAYPWARKFFRMTSLQHVFPRCRYATSKSSSYRAHFWFNRHSSLVLHLALRCTRSSASSPAFQMARHGRRTPPDPATDVRQNNSGRERLATTQPIATLP
jgi:hypothetical protein